MASDLREQYSDVAVAVAVFPGDVGDQSTAEACVAAAVDAFGGLDVLVNSR